MKICTRMKDGSPRFGLDVSSLFAPLLYCERVKINDGT